MTIEELNTRLGWSLNQKIDHAVATIEAFLSRSGTRAYISFSGGKDSTVLLDIARRFVDKDFKAVFCNTGNEFPEIVRFVKTFDNVTHIHPKVSLKQVIEKYGFPLISKEQAQGIRQAKHTNSEKLRNIRLYGTNLEKGYVSGKISEKWKYLIAEKFDVSEKCCDWLKKEPFRRYGKTTGEVPIIGTMVEESQLRKQQYIRRGGCNSFDEKKKASYPISIFTEADIFEYKQRFGINFCEVYDKGAERTGCVCCGFGAHMEKKLRFELLHQLHPARFNAVMNYSNNGCTYKEALQRVGVKLPTDLHICSCGIE